MSTYSCEDFRSRLAQASSLPASTDRESVAWHRHIVECELCRDLLASEERLDELLAAVPEPHVPRDLARRVRAALEPVRARVRAPEDELDRLLELVPEPVVPEGLPDRVLAALQSERSSDQEQAAPFSLLRGRGLLVAAAALLFAFFLFRRAWTTSPGGSPEELGRVAYFHEELQDEDELIVYALENWELLMSDEIEVYLASLDPEEQALFELDLLDGVEEILGEGEAR